MLNRSGTGDVEVRDCAPEDIAAITAIYRQAVLEGSATFELEPPDEATMESRRAALAASGHPYVVAIAAGGLVGYAYAGPYRPRPAYGATVESSVYVRPDRHRRGTGFALMQRLIAQAGAAGFRQMVAVIDDSANLASIKLHERLGFRHVGTLKSVGWKHGRWLDTVLMQRALGAGDAAPR